MRMKKGDSRSRRVVEYFLSCEENVCCSSVALLSFMKSLLSSSPSNSARCRVLLLVETEDEILSGPFILVNNLGIACNKEVEKRDELLDDLLAWIEDTGAQVPTERNAEYVDSGL